ncbi:MAG: phosphate ABC transporter, permease protein PstA, partial [Tolumonas sp.]
VLPEHLARVRALNEEADDLQKGDIGAINYQLEKLRMKERKLQLNNEWNAETEKAFAEQRAELDKEYQELEKRLFDLRGQASHDTLIVKDMRGMEVSIPLAQVLDYALPNQMNLFQKIGHWFHQIGKFVSDEPREANTEGGVFPAIFGT